MWYIIEAEKDAEIITGFKQQVSHEKFLQHLKDKTLLTILNKETAIAGDVFFLPAGRIHAIGKGILLAEIQQTSDATLRIYDYDRLDEKGRSRELHTDKALEAIDFKTYPAYKTQYRKNPDQSNNLARCEYFTVNYLELNIPIEKEYVTLDSFVIYMCIEGSFTIQYHHNGKEKMVKGETVLLPAELKNVLLIPDTTARILEIYIEGLAQKNKSEELLDRLF
jgi:mannose-6-phosphate isomerase